MYFNFKTTHIFKEKLGLKHKKETLDFFNLVLHDHENAG